MPSQDEPLMDVPELAEFLRCSTKWVYESVRLGIIPAIRLGPRKIRFSKQAIDAWLAAQTEAAS